MGYPKVQWSVRDVRVGYTMLYSNMFLTIPLTHRTQVSAKMQHLRQDGPSPHRAASRGGTPDRVFVIYLQLSPEK